MRHEETRMEPLVVSFRQAVELTTLSRHTLLQLSREGILATTKVGRRRLIPLTALRELLQRGVPPKTRP